MAKFVYLPNSKRWRAFEAMSAVRQGKRCCCPFHLHPEQRYDATLMFNEGSMSSKPQRRGLLCYHVKGKRHRYCRL